jgi:hypothetical protein
LKQSVHQASRSSILEGNQLFNRPENVMSTSFFKKAASLLAMGGCLAGLSAPVAAQDTKIVLGMSGWTGFAPLTLADKAGIFKKTGWMWRSR